MLINQTYEPVSNNNSNNKRSYLRVMSNYPQYSNVVYRYCAKLQKLYLSNTLGNI